MCLLTAANSKHVSICVCYVRRDVWISAILSLLMLAANLTLKYIIHVFASPLPPPPAPSKHLKRVLSGDRKWQPCFKGQGYPISENSKKHYQVCMAFFFLFFFLTNNFVFCLQQWYVQQYTRASIMSNFHWSLMANLALKNSSTFSLISHVPAKSDKESFTCIIAGKDPRSVQKRRHIEIISLMTN